MSLCRRTAPQAGGEEYRVSSQVRRGRPSDDHDVTSRLGGGGRNRAISYEIWKRRRDRTGIGRPKRDFPEFGEVRVISRPAPDAEDRLRRLLTLLLKLSAGDGQAESGKDSPPDDRDVNNHREGEA